MHYIVEYERLDDLEVMSIIDEDTDTALVTITGDELQQTLENVVNDKLEELKKQ